MRYALLFTLCALTACEDFEMAVPVDDVETQSIAAPDGAAPAAKAAVKKHRKVTR